MKAALFGRLHSELCEKETVEICLANRPSAQAEAQFNPGFVYGGKTAKKSVKSGRTLERAQ